MIVGDTYVCFQTVKVIFKIVRVFVKHESLVGSIKFRILNREIFEKLKTTFFDSSFSKSPTIIFHVLQKSF